MASYSVAGAYRAIRPGILQVRYIEFRVVQEGSLRIEVRNTDGTDLANNGDLASFILFTADEFGSPLQPRGFAQGGSPAVTTIPELPAGDYVLAFSEALLTEEEARSGENEDDDVPPFSYAVTLIEGTAVITAPRDAVVGTDIEEMMTGTGSGELIIGHGGGDYIVAEGGDDTIQAGDGDDNVDAGSGDDDLFLSGAGSRVVDGGEGNDRLHIDWSQLAAAFVTTAEGGGYHGGFRSTDGLWTVVHRDFEHMTITGGGGADHIWTGIGDDVVDGGAGDDTIHTAAGTDRVLVRGGTTAADTGTDTVHMGGGAADRLEVDYRNVSEVITMAVPVEGADGTGGSVAIAGQMRATFSGVEHLVLYSGSGSDTLYGTFDDDRVYGGAGNDVIHGLSGSDGLFGQGGNDVLYGGEGDDSLHYSVSSGAGHGEAHGGAGLDHLFAHFYGSASGVTVSMVEDADGVYSGLFTNHADRTLSFTGVEWFFFDGSSHDDRIVGGSYHDWLSGNDGADHLDGGDGNDQVLGGDGADMLFGGEGDDELHGGPGADEMSGGSGSDSYNVDHVGDVVREAEGDDGFDEVFTEMSLYALGGGVENLTGTSNTEQHLIGNSLRNRITGGTGNDRIEGGEGPDVLAGGAGADVVEGGDNVDAIFSGDITPDYPFVVFPMSIDFGLEQDTLTGGAGYDLLFAGYGDNVDGGADYDTLYITFRAAPEGVRADFRDAATSVTIGGATITSIEEVSGIEGSDFDDFIALREGYDSRSGLIEGRGGNDHIITGGAASHVEGGEGDDILDGSLTLGRVMLVGGAGADHLIGGGGVGNDFLFGGDGDDILEAGANHDWLYGEAGDDSLDGGEATDLMQGGIGNDRYVVDEAGDVVEELEGEGTDRVETGLASYTLAANVENLTGTSGAGQSLTGNGLNNIVTAGGGNDVLYLQDGGVDTASGGGGNDGFVMGAAMTSADAVDGGEGNDQLVLQGDYATTPLTLGAGVTNVESIALLRANNTLFGGQAAGLFSYDITVVTQNVAPGQLVIVDGAQLRAGENFTFNGAAETDGGGYKLYGGYGIETLTGGTSADLFYFNEGRFGASDSVRGGAGSARDELGLGGDYTVTFGAGQIEGIEVLVLLSGRGRPTQTDFDYDITMHDANLASGVQMIVDAAQLKEAEHLTFDGSAESNGTFRIFGGRSDDAITAGQGADIVNGRAGNDALRGWFGADTLSGGAGNDRFVYGLLAESLPDQRDTVSDFTLGDLIDLSAFDTDSSTAGDDAFSYIGSSAYSANGTAEVRTVQQGNVWFVSADLDGNGSDDLVINVTAADGQPLTQDSFVL